MREPSRAPRLMLVTDAARTRWPLLDLAAEAVAGGVDAIYLGYIDLLGEEMAGLVRTLRERIGAQAGDKGTACRASAGYAVSIAGNPILARKLGVGLHLRERDMDSADARALVGPEIMIGKAVHDVQGARRAVGADYLLAGHVFPSRSKPGRAPLGRAGLAAVVAAAPCPVLAIGGITPERVADVVQAGAHGIAVIGAIAEANAPRAAAASLRAALDTALRQRTQELIRA